MIIVYISNRYIRVVDGESANNRIQVKNVCMTKDTNGCILNGVLMDPDGFSKLVEELWTENNLSKKGVKLVIDSNQFTTKVVQLPKQKQKQMLVFVSREFTDVGRMEDPIFGYFPMQVPVDAFQQETKEESTTLEEGQDTSKKHTSLKKSDKKTEKKAKKPKKEKKIKMTQVFATAVPREQAKGFVQLFEDLGISVCGIESGRGAAVQLAERLNCIKNKTCIIQFVDDMVLINMLFDRGSYVYASRTRMFSEPGTADFAVEAARTVNNILQFAQAQKLPEAVETVYIAGIAPEIMEIYEDSIRRINGTIQAEWLTANGEVSFSSGSDVERTFSDYAIAIGGLSKDDGKADLITQLRLDPEKMMLRAKKRRVLIPICVLGGVFVLATAVSGGRVLILKHQLKQVKEYTKDEKNLEACDQYDQTYSYLNAIGALSNNMTMLEENILHYPKVDGSINDQLQQCAAGLVDIQVTGYNAEDGTFSFQSSASNADKIHQFISVLNQQKIFAIVDYSGYTQDSDGKWNVNVFCTMAARQEEQ